MNESFLSFSFLSVSDCKVISEYFHMIIFVEETVLLPEGCNDLMVEIAHTSLNMKECKNFVNSLL